MNDIFGGDQYVEIGLLPPSFAFVFLFFGLTGDYVGTYYPPMAVARQFLQICVGNGQAGHQGSNHTGERHGKVSGVCLSDICHL